jgi:uroporphyrinogen decarboxylase
MSAFRAKPLLSILAGEQLAPPPIWLMRQAGRYLPEYRELRARAGSFLALCYDPILAAEVTLQPVRRFQLDAAILFADILLVPQALGADVRFEEGEGPRLAPVTSVHGLRRLNAHGMLDRLAPVFETVRRVRAELPAKVALIGFAGAPWTVATYMIAGRATPDQKDAKLRAYQDPGFVAALIADLTAATISYLCAQADAGAEVLQLFDTWAGGLAEPLLEPLVFAPTREIVAALKRRHPKVPIIGFPRGIGLHLPAYARTTRVDAVGLATGDDVRLAAALIPRDVVLQGCLDPLALIVGGKTLQNAVERLLADMGDRPFVFNLGHGILPETPPEHVAELVRMIRNGDPK